MLNLASARDIWPIAAILLLILAGCGGTEEVATPFTPEGLLLARAREAFRAASAGSWEELYQYTSPRSRAECDLEGYTARVDNYLRLVRGFMAVANEAPLAIRAAYATVKGDEGFVAIDFLAKGKPLLFDEDEQVRWVFLDGEWWLEEEAWRFGCVGWKLFD